MRNGWASATHLPPEVNRLSNSRENGRQDEKTASDTVDACSHACRNGISYPDGIQAPDGTIYISYDRNRATDGEILMARFTEEDILAKEPIGPESKLKMLISRPLGARSRRD
jgi:hypothetical protein